MYRLVPFSQIKENRRILIPEIAEDNVGLEYLLSYCVDNDIETYSSCGDVHPYIEFIINNKTKDALYGMCSLLINSQDVREYIVVRLGSINGNNVCRISYYDNENINIVEFFVIITNYLRKAFIKGNYENWLWESANEVVNFISKHGFDNYFEVVKDTDLNSGEDTYMYYLTIHSTNYKKISDFQGKYFPNVIRDYTNQSYDDYSIGYYTDDIETLLTGRKLVRKK